MDEVPKKGFNGLTPLPVLALDQRWPLFFLMAILFHQCSAFSLLGSDLRLRRRWATCMHKLPAAQHVLGSSARFFQPYLSVCAYGVCYVPINLVRTTQNNSIEDEIWRQKICHYLNLALIKKTVSDQYVPHNPGFIGRSKHTDQTLS